MMKENGLGDAFWDSGCIGKDIRIIWMLMGWKKKHLKGLVTRSRANTLEVGVIREWVEQEIEAEVVYWDLKYQD